MAETPTTTAPGSQTLARGLTALQLVADAPAGLTVQQVADGVGVHRTIAYRLLATLTQFRFVAKGQDGRYRPAAGLAVLGASFDRNVRQLSVPILRALAEKEDGHWASALADLRRALTIAAPRSYMRVFLDEGRELAALIDRLDMEQLRGTEAAPLARRLQRALCTPDVQGNAPIGMGEELTKRELSILKRLETGLSNKEIAESIFVSEGTLKWHLHNVYGKLNVKNRARAMVRARELGIL